MNTTFQIGLDDLKDLADALCELDSWKPSGNRRAADLVSRGHAAIERALGDQAGLVYVKDDAPAEEAAA